MRLVFVVCISILCSCVAMGQKLESNRAGIASARTALKPALQQFFTGTVDKPLEQNIISLIDNPAFNKADAYHNYLIGGALYSIAPQLSFQYHKKAYELLPTDLNTTFEYALELHRKQDFAAAIPLYESYLATQPDDHRIYALLADCYINTGDVKKAKDAWGKTDFHNKHTGIDEAIHIIYGSSRELQRRDSLISQLKAGNTSVASTLIFMDANWQHDWWNTVVQTELLNHDIELVGTTLGDKNSNYQLLKMYADIKLDRDEAMPADSLKAILNSNKILINGAAIPQPGAIASDLLRICLRKNVITAEDFYKKRGAELLALAKSTNDVELLNMYAYLQAGVEKNGVKPEIDKLGWQQFKDERFAISYFIGKAEKNRYDDPELAQALKDFPTSAKLQWIKTNCAQIEKKDLKPNLIRLIQLEFKTLGSSPDKYAEYLDSYIGYL